MTTRLDRSIWRIAIASAIVVAAASSTAYAQDDVFKRGMDARKDKKWPDVAAAMRRASESDPNESARKLAGSSDSEETNTCRSSTSGKRCWAWGTARAR